MNRIIAVCCVLSTILAPATNAAEPDWKARYAELKQEERKNFKKTAVKGKQLTVTLTNGRKLTGVLTGLTEHGVVLTISGRYHTIPRKKLGGATRMALFPSDYAHAKAMTRLKREQLAYQQKNRGSKGTEGAKPEAKKHPGYVVVMPNNTGGHMHGRVIMRGAVKNRTGVPLRDVKVYITYRDVNGRVLGTWDAPIESTNLPPDTQCNYEVMCRYSKRTAGTQIQFKTGDGQELEVRYHE